MYELPWHKKTWIWLKNNWYVPVTIVALVLGMFLYIASAGRANVTSRVLRSMRKNQDKADAEIRVLEDEAEEKIQEAEKRYQEALEQFTEDQKKEYDRVRRRGPGAVASWLSDFDRTI